MKQVEPSLNFSLEQFIFRHLLVVEIIAVNHAFRSGLDVDFIRRRDFLQIPAEGFFFGILRDIKEINAMFKGQRQDLFSLRFTKSIE